MLYLEILRNKESRYVERYIRFIEWCKDVNQNYVGFTERHHILPESLFPQYKSFNKNPWNLIRLTPRQHFIAHWMLAKIYGGKQWFSFNMMKRVGHNSCLYEAARIYLSEEISKMNSGWVPSEDQRSVVSIRTKNTVVVKNSNGDMFRVNTDDPRYLSGELLFYRTGSKHKSSTIQKMKDNNGLKGKHAFISADGETMVYLTLEEGQRLGLQKGITETARKNAALGATGKIWVTVIETGEYKRIYEKDFDDTRFTRGRAGYVGWGIVNERRRKNNPPKIKENLPPKAGKGVKRPEHSDYMKIKQKENWDNPNYRRKIKESNSEKYTIYSPDGIVYDDVYLGDFCKEHHLSFTTLWLSAKKDGKKITKGRASGWICKVKR